MTRAPDEAARMRDLFAPKRTLFYVSAKCQCGGRVEATGAGMIRGVPCTACGRAYTIHFETGHVEAERLQNSLAVATTDEPFVPEAVLCRLPAPAQRDDFHDIAEEYVLVAVETPPGVMLWGRIGNRWIANPSPREALRVLYEASTYRRGSGS